MLEKEITFKDLGIGEKILKKIEEKGYLNPTPIQSQVIPLLLNGNKDIIGQAQTGTGKTASFAIPILERIKRNNNNIQALILTPTRELAIQIAEEINSFTDSDIKVQLLYGGQNIRSELLGLKNNPHIVVGTPGRVIDHLTKKKSLNIDSIKYFVLDEADEMLNIGFKDDIEEIIGFTPEEKKVLLFSATMPRGIQEIVKKYIKDHDKITIKKEELTNSLINQKCYRVSEKDKFEALCRVIEVEFDFYGILFCKTKADVDEVAAKLLNRGYKVEGIHGDIEQKMREKTLSRFKNKSITILVATDVAARGIDVSNLTHVINYSLPDNPENYTHRIGRTGRAGQTGEAISFITRRDGRALDWIERVTKTKISIETLPKVSEVIEFKKKKLIDNISKSLGSGDELNYIDLAKDLLELSEKPEEVLAAILKEGYGKEFSIANYSDLREENFSNEGRVDRGQRGYSGIDGQRRLFVAKGKLDGISPAGLIKFIEKEINSKLGDVGNIDIMREFSFINLTNQDADFVLGKFKSLNPRKPLIVEAKQRDGGMSNSFSSRKTNGFGYSKTRRGEYKKKSY